MEAIYYGGSIIMVAIYGSSIWRQYVTPASMYCTYMVGGCNGSLLWRMWGRKFKWAEDVGRYWSNEVRKLPEVFCPPTPKDRERAQLWPSPVVGRGREFLRRHYPSSSFGSVCVG